MSSMRIFTAETKVKLFWAISHEMRQRSLKILQCYIAGDKKTFCSWEVYNKVVGFLTTHYKTGEGPYSPVKTLKWNSVEDYSSSRVGDWMSDVGCRVPKFKHGIISKQFELEGWNCVWCFFMTWQARFSSIKNIGPPLPPPETGSKG